MLFISDRIFIGFTYFYCTKFNCLLFVLVGCGKGVWGHGACWRGYQERGAGSGGQGSVKEG